jgi:hypothetical protein
VAATLTTQVHHDLLCKLQFDLKNYKFIKIGNDRPNVAQVVHAMEHPMNTFCDLNFFIPDNVQVVTDIPKAFVYSNDIAIGNKMTDHLNGRIAEELQRLGLVRPYNAGMSKSTYAI